MVSAQLSWSSSSSVVSLWRTTRFDSNLSWLSGNIGDRHVNERRSFSFRGVRYFMAATDDGFPRLVLKRAFVFGSRARFCAIF